MNKKLKEKWNEISNRFEKGESCNELAKKYDLSSTTLQRWLMKDGYIHRKKGRYPNAMHAKARDLHRRGFNFDRIAAIQNVSVEKIIEWCNEKYDKNERRRLSNPAPRREDLSQEAQKIIKSKRKPRHIRNKWWTKEQKDFVVKLIKRRLPVIAVYRATGASRARQSKIFREYYNKTPINFSKKKSEKYSRENRIKKVLKFSEDIARGDIVKKLRGSILRTSSERIKELPVIKRKSIEARRGEAQPQSPVRGPEAPAGPQIGRKIRVYAPPKATLEGEPGLKDDILSKGRLR
jgi:transposase